MDRSAGTFEPEHANANTSAAGEAGPSAELRERCARLRDVVRTECEPGGVGPCTAPAPCAGYAAIGQVLDAAADAERQVRATRASAARDRALAGGLAESMRSLAEVDAPGPLIARIPELALRCCFALAAALVQVDDAAAEVLASAGGPLAAEVAELEREARAAANPARRPEVRTAGRLALFPLASGSPALVLAVERASDAEADASERDALVAFGSVASAALARARDAAALREASQRDSALLGAMHEGALAIDREGVVRAVNAAGAAALGVRREDLVGRRLRDVPGLGPLATVLRSPDREPVRSVSLTRGEVLVRAQPHEAGVVATVRDLRTDEAFAQRSVGSLARYTFDNVVGASPALRHVVESARRAAEGDWPVLIGGESGTGKEVLAQAIHNASPRAAEPFLAINVAAIPRELLESELFGYEGGTFTGARSAGRPGKLELAGRGTLLLDEIGDMPAEMQAKLLRVLQERLFQRLGSARDIHVRARIIATTNRDLAEAVALGRFRLDLYHRLCVIRFELPPLRERRGDVPLLVEAQLRAHAERTGRRVGIAPQVRAAFEAYDWPGNVRELVNTLDGELSVLPAGEATLTRIPPTMVERREPARARTLTPDAVLPLEELERRACEETLAAFGGNVRRAARALGVARQTLYNKMKRYGIAFDLAQEDGAAHDGARARR